MQHFSSSVFLKCRDDWRLLYLPPLAHVQHTRLLKSTTHPFPFVHHLQLVFVCLDGKNFNNSAALADSMLWVLLQCTELGWHSLHCWILLLCRLCSAVLDDILELSRFRLEKGQNPLLTLSRRSKDAHVCDFAAICGSGEGSTYAMMQTSYSPVFHGKSFAHDYVWRLL